MNKLKQISFLLIAMAALFATAAAQKIKTPPGIPQLAGDLQIAKLWVSQHPEITGAFNTYSAQPTIQKTKGFSYAAFTVQTTAFDIDGKAVKTCTVDIGFENKDQEFIEHPKLRCDITDEKIARSVVRWTSTVDAKKQVQESNEGNNTKEFVYRPNLRIKSMTYVMGKLQVVVENSCFVRSVPAVVNLRIAVLRDGLPYNTLITSDRDLVAVEGKSNATIRFTVPETLQERVNKKEAQELVTVDPAGVNNEIFKGDNVQSLGQNAKLPAVSLNPVCAAN